MHESNGGTLWYRREGAVVESVAVGPMDETNPAVLIAELEKGWAEEGWCGAFHDWERVTGYSTATRLDWVKWATTPGGRSARFSHFRLSRDPLVRMAVSVASVAFSYQTFTVHETAASFAAARRSFLSPPPPIPEIPSRR